MSALIDKLTEHRTMSQYRKVDDLVSEMTNLNHEAASRIKGLESQLAQEKALSIVKDEAIENYASAVKSYQDQLAEAKKDQARYQWLRQQNWCDSDLCVVTKPKSNLKLGSYCPSLELLDDEIDAAIESIQE